MYKLAILIESYAPKIITRIVRDVLTVQRLCKSKKSEFVVACDEILSKQLNSMGVVTTPDFLNSNDFRCYTLTTFSNTLKDRILDGVPCEFITVEPVKDPKGLIVEKDPYAGVKFPTLVKRIPNTMDLDKPAPSSKTGEPVWNPFISL